jgi:hypothetical protein
MQTNSALLFISQSQKNYFLRPAIRLQEAKLAYAQLQVGFNFFSISRFEKSLQPKRGFNA